MRHLIIALVLSTPSLAAWANQPPKAADEPVPAAWSEARRDLARRLIELRPQNPSDAPELRESIAREVLAAPIAVDEYDGVAWVIRGATRDAFGSEGWAEPSQCSPRDQLIDALIEDLRLDLLEDIPDQPDTMAKRLFFQRSIPTLKWSLGVAIAGGTVCAIGAARALWVVAHAGLTDEVLATGLATSVVGTATFAAVGLMKFSLRLVSEDWHARIDACTDALESVRRTTSLPSGPRLPRP